MPRTQVQTRTLHEALDLYRHSIAASATTTPWQKTRRSLAARLRVVHSNHPLRKLDLDRCVAMIAYWRERPLKNGGQPLSRNMCTHYLKELVRFFQWLHYSEDFKWKSPLGFERIDRRIKNLPEDRRLCVEKVTSVAELSLLYQHADKISQLIICLALNCGLRPADMGRLCTAASDAIGNADSLGANFRRVS